VGREHYHEGRGQTLRDAIDDAIRICRSIRPLEPPDLAEQHLDD
jgi:hypothetical protein